MLSDEIKQQAVEYARHLVSDQDSDSASTYKRLLEIGKRLNVERIEPNCTVGDGCVSRIRNGAFVVFYKSENPLVRRRYTVAHEFAHIVLERFYPHIGCETLRARRQGESSTLEKFVNRIASELLMPEPLFVNLLKAAERDLPYNISSATKSIVEWVQARLGVSQSAVLFRLIELQHLDAILGRVFTDTGKSVNYVSEHGRVKLADTWQAELKAISDNVATTDLVGSGHLNAVFSGRQVVVDCDVWFRTIAPRKCVGELGRTPGVIGISNREYWIVGWKWMKSHGHDLSCNARNNRYHGRK